MCAYEYNTHKLVKQHSAIVQNLKEWIQANSCQTTASLSLEDEQPRKKSCMSAFTCNRGLTVTMDKSNSHAQEKAATSDERTQEESQTRVQNPVRVAQPAAADSQKARSLEAANTKKAGSHSADKVHICMS